MAAPALPFTLLLLALLPAAGGAGEGAAGQPAPAGLVRAAPYQPRGRAVEYPDTIRKPVALPDTVQLHPAPVALTPDGDEKLTRKSVLYTVGAIAVLTLTTLLLYNVRSR